MAQRKYDQPTCGKCGWFVKYIGERVVKDKGLIAHYKCKRCGIMSHMDVDYIEEDYPNW